MDKREKTERQRQEDIALHKVLYWMFGAALLIFVLRLAQTYYVDFETTDFAINLAWTIGVALPWIAVAGVALAAAFAYWGLRWKKTGKTTVLPWALSGFSVGLAVCALGVWQLGGGGVTLLSYMAIGLCALAVIYYLYQRDFVAVACACGLGLLGLWLFFREGATTRLYVAMALLVLLLAAVAVFARYLQQHGGTLTVKGKSIEVFTKGASYAMIYLTCAIMAVVLIVALVSGAALSHMAFYAVPVAWLLIMAVYYTVKLM